MHILFIDWNGYGNEDMKAVFREKGYRVDVCLFPQGIRTRQAEADRILRSRLKKGGYDFAFSLNYFPVVSVLCREFELPYVSWVYDSPYIHVYSYTVLNSCNYIFLFDYGVYQELSAEGIGTVYYLPLAVNEKRYAGLENGGRQKQGFEADLSFVGSLYDEPKHRLYDKFKDVDAFTRGYLDAVMAAQKKVYGVNFLKSLLTPEILAQMQKAYPTDPNAETVMSPEALYADYVLARQVTAMERREILELLGKRFSGDTIKLYTNNRAAEFAGIQNLGPVEYYGEMPFVFYGSKINLNITLRSIRTGIPLRAFDIMGCGGFLLTNYQEEFSWYFEPGQDFIYYEDYEDLLSKAEYYLTHEKERLEIAENGCRKVRTEHTISRRVEAIEAVLKEGHEEKRG